MRPTNSVLFSPERSVCEWLVQLTVFCGGEPYISSLSLPQELSSAAVSSVPPKIRSQNDFILTHNEQTTS